jgi:hypothetical protein
MGHHYNVIIGEGKNRLEAQRNAVDDFIRKEGTRHSVRDISYGKMIEELPPLGVFSVNASGTKIHDFTRRNHDAPKDQWVQRWEFELHTHA